ncbi:MAG: adenine deaminase C-terminal domain-containing protein [Acidimicrobiia bacterium]
MDRRRLIDTALGARSPDLLLRGGRVLSVHTREIHTADVVIVGDRIAALASPGTVEVGDAAVVDLDGRIVVPGLIDPHVHVESSNVTVSELARAIVPRGVLTLCADPHEIANVLGVAGIEMLLDEAASLPLSLLLRVPGRVPALAAHLETSGYEMDMDATMALLDRTDAVCLGGDINPALLLGADDDQLRKIEATISRGKTVGGQLPGFLGEVLDASVCSGIEDTHVAESVEEVLEQLRRGLRVLLTPRIDRLPAEQWPELADAMVRGGIDTRNLVLCTDDVHPNMLRREGHLDHRVRLAIESGFDPMQAVQMATINAADLMRLDRDRGSVTPGKVADLVIVDDLAEFTASMVVRSGVIVAIDGELVDDPPPFAVPGSAVGTIHLPRAIVAADLAVASDVVGSVEVNVVVFGGPKTMRQATLEVIDGIVEPDASLDVVSIAVLERHRATGLVGKGFVGGLGIRGGAVACTVNHDSHNLFVVGDSRESMAIAANALADAGGGYCVVVGTQVRALVPLPVAGLLSLRPLAEVADGLDDVERLLVDELSMSIPHRPIYALNFLCLPNIPDVGVTDRGIIETATMSLVPTVVGSAHGSPAVVSVPAP